MTTATAPHPRRSFLRGSALLATTSVSAILAWPLWKYASAKSSPPTDASPKPAASSQRLVVDGTPIVIAQLHDGSFVAYRATCPHLGCLIAFDAQQQELVCPCHGARFDVHSGVPVVGPATTPLVRVDIDPRDGRVLRSQSRQP